MKKYKNTENIDKSISFERIINAETPIVIRKFSIWIYDIPNDFRKNENFKIDVLLSEVNDVRNFYKPISKF